MRPFALLPLALILPVPAWAQAEQPGLSAADLAQPTLIRWQRSLADAEAVSRATGKPLLICVNADEEPGSQVFAGTKYRDAEFAALVAAYVPIVFATNRHTQKDHDTSGRRIPCTRFGGITCGEHMRDEPLAYERYMNGDRAAPRHIGVSAGGTVLFDHSGVEDLARVDAALREHGDPVGEEGWRRLFASRDAIDRAELEEAYLAGDAAMRAELLRAAAESTAEPYDLILLGLSEDDPTLRWLAIEALGKTAEVRAIDLLLATSREERGGAAEPLRAALSRLAETEPRARRVLAARRAMALEPRVIRVSAWRAALLSATGTTVPKAQVTDYAAKLKAMRQASEASPEDQELLIRVARMALDFARSERSEGRDPSYLLVDADHYAGLAGERGAAPSVVLELRAHIAFLRGEDRAAGDFAEAALPERLLDPAGRETAALLDVFATSRVRSIYAAEGADEGWPAEWFAEAHAAFRVLAEHPAGTVEQVFVHTDLLLAFELEDERGGALRAALVRYNGSDKVHTRFRSHIVRSRGLPALFDAYDAVRPSVPNLATHDWFGGYGGLVLAEDRMRVGAEEEARAAYEESVRRFDASIAAQPSFESTANHYVALAMSALARLALGEQDLERAAELAAEAIRRRPASAESRDGFGRTPLFTVQAVRLALESAGREELAKQFAESVLSADADVWVKASR